MDHLQELFDCCKKFQTKIKDYDLPNRNAEEVKNSVVSIIAEIGEILEEFQDWKDWKKNIVPITEKILLSEVADLWHFVINLTLYLGFDSEELYLAFIEKNKINFQRQDGGY